MDPSTRNAILVVLAIVAVGYVFFSSQYLYRPKLFQEYSSYTVTAVSAAGSGECHSGFADFDGDGKLENYSVCVQPSGVYVNVAINDGGHTYSYHEYVGGSSSATPDLRDVAVARFDGRDYLYLYVVDEYVVALLRWSPSTGMQRVSWNNDDQPYAFCCGVGPVHTPHGDVLFAGWAHSDNVAYVWHVMYSTDGTTFTSLTSGVYSQIYPLSWGVDQQGNPVVVAKTSSGSIRLFYDGSWHDCTSSSPLCSADAVSSISDGYFVVKSGGKYYAMIWPDTVVGDISYISGSYPSLDYHAAPITGMFSGGGAYYYGAYWRSGYVTPIAVQFVDNSDWICNYSTDEQYAFASDGTPLYVVCSSSGSGQYVCTQYRAPYAAPGFEANLLLPEGASQSIVALNPEYNVDHLVVSAHDYTVPLSGDNMSIAWYLDGVQVAASSSDVNIPVSTPGHHVLTLLASVDTNTYSADWNFFVPTFPYDVNLDSNVSWNGSGWSGTLSASALWADENGLVSPADLNYYLVVYAPDGNVLAEGNSPLPVSVSEQNVPSGDLNVLVSVFTPDPTYDLNVYRVLHLSKPAPSSSGGISGEVSPATPVASTSAASVSVTGAESSHSFSSSFVLVSALVVLGFIGYFAYRRP